MFIGPSKIKTETINEITKEWIKVQPTYGYEASRKFIKHMRLLGWKKRGQSSKIAIYKNSIVAKFGCNRYAKYDASKITDIGEEVKQWFSAPKTFKKYLPRLYFYYNGMLVQDLVFNKCNDTDCKVNKIADEFNLQDYNHNHGHNLSGNIKFFDFVSPYIWIRKSPSLEKCTERLLSSFNINLESI